MSTVGLEGTHILYEDELSPTGQHSGKDDGDHADTIHIDTGRVGHGTVLSDCTELLPDAGLHDCVVEHT